MTAESPRLVVFTKTGCPFCAMVLEELERLHLKFDERNVSDRRNYDELMKHGKLPQVPYLMDLESGEAMYESDRIVNYLRHRYGHHG